MFGPYWNFPVLMIRGRGGSSMFKWGQLTSLIFKKIIFISKFLYSLVEKTIKPIKLTPIGGTKFLYA
jgi:hypothetical protein